MKNSWILTSLISGIAAGILCYVLTRNWPLSILSAVLVGVVVLMNNPKRRYMKAFWAILSMVLILNKFFFAVAGNLLGTQFVAGTDEVGDGVSIALVILAGICLLLDYLERNGKLNSKFFSVQKNRVGDITGNNNSINQTNVGEK